MKFSSPVLPPKNGLRIAHLSDLHLGKQAFPDHRWMIRTWRNLLRLAEVDVFVISGDLAQHPEDEAVFDEVMAVFDGHDVLVVPGNHDVLDPARAERFQKRFGEFPRTERRQHVEFLLFDSFAGVPMAQRDEDELARFAVGKCLRHGRVDVSSMQRFSAEPSTPPARIAVVHHHPERLRPDDDATMVPLLNTEEFLDWCAGNAITAVLYGHIHRPREVWTERGVLMLRGSASTKVPSVIRLLDVTPDAEVLVHEFRVD